MTDRPPVSGEPSTAQYFDPLAVMVGEFARDFVEPKNRMDAIDRLYVLLREARATPPSLDVERLAAWFHNRWESQGIACYHRNQYISAWDCGQDAIDAADWLTTEGDKP